MNRLHILRMLKKIIKKSRKKDAKSIIALLKKNIRKNKNKTRKIKHNQSKTKTRTKQNKTKAKKSKSKKNIKIR